MVAIQGEAYKIFLLFMADKVEASQNILADRRQLIHIKPPAHTAASRPLPGESHQVSWDR